MKPRVDGNEIRFFVDPRYLPRDEDWYVKRIAQLICGSNTVFKKEGGYRWQLDGSNDWWMGRGEEPAEFIVAYRYGLTKEMAEKLSMLRDTIIWLLDLERFNEEK